jgi:hypothetical protein
MKTLTAEQYRQQSDLLINNVREAIHHTLSRMGHNPFTLEDAEDTETFSAYSFLKIGINKKEVYVIIGDNYSDHQYTKQLWEFGFNDLLYLLKYLQNDYSSL